MNESHVLQPVVTETEAARILGLSVKTLRRWRWAGKGPRFLKIGAAVRYDLADLEAYIASCKRSSTSDYGRDEIPHRWASMLNARGLELLRRANEARRGAL
jgi:predicted DNA-binding transcriptional regulator AlpA